MNEAISNQIVEAATETQITGTEGFGEVRLVLERELANKPGDSETLGQMLTQLDNLKVAAEMFNIQDRGIKEILTIIHQETSAFEDLGEYLFPKPKIDNVVNLEDFRN